jgi:hypothetical protein
MGGTQAPAGAGNVITAVAWGGTSNSNLDLTKVLAQLGPTSVTPFALAQGGLLNPTSNPYSLTIGVMITRSSAGSTTGDLNLQVPEPTSMALFGIGLMGVGAAARRRRQAQ